MPRIGFTWDHILIYHNMNLYRVFLEALDPYIDQSLHDWSSLIEKEAVRISNEDARLDFYSFHSDQYSHRLQVRPILMNACFTAIFAMFEDQLLWICSLAKEHSNSKFSISHLGGSSSTEKAKKYLEILEVDFPAGGSEWKRVTLLREIRNRIMHNRAILIDRKNNNETVNFARDNDIVVSTVIQDNEEYIHHDPDQESGQDEDVEILHLELTRAFCDAELNHLEDFLLQVYEVFGTWRAKASAT